LNSPELVTTPVAAQQPERFRPAIQLVRAHWRLYLIEAALLGMFMISACVFAMLLEHPGSAVHRSISSAFVRRALMGLAMGGTAVALIYSRLGRRSGALMNPATTLCFLRLRRIEPVDAACYTAAQFVGGALGVAIVAGAARSPVMHPAVAYVTTQPGMAGVIAAWIAEYLIALIMLWMVLSVNKRPRLAPYAGVFAGLLVAIYITFEAPISGMSLNPARSFASALHAHEFGDLWIYFTAPVLGMLSAVEIHSRLTRAPQRLCGKFSHSRTVRCIFKCNCLTQSAEARHA